VWRVLASLLGAAVLLASRIACASPPPVHLAVQHCASLDAASIRRIFAADLGTSLTAQLGPDVTEVSISCEGDRVVVQVKDPLSRKTVRRSFDPKSFGNQGQSRLIAIAASELVLASWAELTENPTPEVPGEGAPVKPETVETARSVVKARSAERKPAPSPDGADTSAASDMAGASPTTEAAVPDHPVHAPSEHQTPTAPVFQRVMAVFSFRSFVSGEGALVGGGARFGQERYGVVSWAADALIESGKIASHDVTSATLGGWLAFYAHFEPVTLRLGGGLRAGILGLTDGPVIAAWGWPMLVSSMTIRDGPLVLEFAGEAGLVALFVQRGQAVRGVWASGQLGFGLVL
jgi:hypothetical protein